jgi:hypothetical protein
MIKRFNDRKTLSSFCSAIPVIFDPGITSGITIELDPSLDRFPKPFALSKSLKIKLRTQRSKKIFGSAAQRPARGCNPLQPWNQTREVLVGRLATLSPRFGIQIHCHN